MTGVHQAYRFALDPTPAQQRALASHVGASRFAYNWGLALVKSRLDARATGEQVPVPWSLAALRREWNQAKRQVAPWWAANSKEAYSSGLHGLARALQSFSDAKAGRRKGQHTGFPRFKVKGRCKESVRFTTGAIRVEPDRTHVVLPRLGRIKTHESTRKLARRLEAGTARILSATVTQTAGRWFVAFTCHVERADRPAIRPGAVVGVDLGVASLAVLSVPVAGLTDAQGRVANPEHLAKALGRLRRVSRRASRRLGPWDPATSRRRTPSNRWLRADQARSRLHARIAAARRDRLHKLTTTLAGRFGTLVVEDLHVAGMLANRRLARPIADASWAQLRQQLAYKTTWRGGRLVVADRWYPSSKTCSGCGAVRAKLALTERVFECTTCGFVADRDVNAARNLAALARHVAGSGPETPNGRGADQKTRLGGQVAVKRQPGTASAGKTGTVRPRGRAGLAEPTHAR